MKKPEKLTIADCEQALGREAKQWEGRCMQIASEIVAAKLVRGVPVYGHFLGEVAKKSSFYRSSRVGFARHGWILLPDMRVLDPTRWAFEARAPYLFLGEEGSEYDEGGNRAREAMRGQPAIPDDDARRPYAAPLTHQVSSACWAKIAAFLRDEGGIIDGFTEGQLFALANADPRRWGEDAPDLYRYIARVRSEALIPTDNLDMVRRKGWAQRCARRAA